MADFTMPSLGADMDTGIVLEWRVKPGDTVHKGDIVAVVDTDKADIDVEIFHDGVIDEILVPPGEEVPVGTPLARLTPAAAPTPAPAPSGPPATPPPEAKAKAEAAGPAKAATPRRRRRARPVHETVEIAAARAAGPPTTATRRGGRRSTETGAAHVRASPLARQRAAERGVDLADIVGSGAGGAVLVADVEQAAAASPVRVERPTPAQPTAGRRDAMRHAIAELMARSKREIPHYYLATTIDFARAREWLDEANTRRPVAARLLPGALLLKATALAAREAPDLNGFWNDDDFRPSPAVHLGVAVSLRGGGLVAPAIHDADRLDVDELMSALRDLIQRARAGRLRSAEMADPTITVTNLGDQGVDEVHGVIYPPQVALVGFGKIVQRPWAVDGLLGVRPVVRATLAADHRATDGHVGGRFLATIDRLLQAPEDL